MGEAVPTRLGALIVSVVARSCGRERLVRSAPSAAIGRRDGRVIGATTAAIGPVIGPTITKWKGLPLGQGSPFCRLSSGNRVKVGLDFCEKVGYGIFERFGRVGGGLDPIVICNEAKEKNFPQNRSILLRLTKKKIFPRIEVSY